MAQKHPDDRRLGARPGEVVQIPLDHEGRRYQTLVEHSPYCIHEIDLDGALTSMNPAGLRMMGVSGEREIVGMPYLDAVSEGDRPRVAALLEAALDGEPSDFQFEAVNGLFFRSTFVPILEPDGRVARLMGLTLDVTETVRSERALRSSEALLSEAQAVAHLGNWERDVASDRMSCSDEVFRILGWQPGAGGLTFADFVECAHPEDAAAFLDLERSLRTRPSAEFRARVVRPDGVVRWVAGHGRTRFDDDGRPVRMFGVMQDITEQHELEAQLRQAQRVESLGRLAGGVAHDFNNMLGVILGQVELALLQVDDPEQVRGHLESIRDAGTRSAELTRQLLAFARRQPVIPRVLDLNEAVDGMLSMLRRLLGENIDLVWEPRQGLWPVKVDPTQLDQLLTNLAVNARDAIQGVGRLTVATGNASGGEAIWATQVGVKPEEFVTLTVSDDGCGMDAETLERAFEPFFTTKAPGQGTGLGLAMVFGMVSQNGGSIRAESKPGLGTTFEIRLPRYVGPDASAPVHVGEEPVIHKGHETILVTEDERALLEMVTTMLELEGYTVLPASTPAEALRLAEEHAGEIQLMLTDVIMPTMNGPDLFDAVSAWHPELERLFMSGYTADIIADRGVLHDGIHFLQKPFTLAELAKRVRQVLDSRREEAGCGS